MAATPAGRPIRRLTADPGRTARLLALPGKLRGWLVNLEKLSRVLVVIRDAAGAIEDIFNGGDAAAPSPAEPEAS